MALATSKVVINTMYNRVYGPDIKTASVGSNASIQTLAVQITSVHRSL